LDGRTLKRNKGRKLSAVLAAALIALVPLATVLIIVHDTAASIPDGSRYIFEDPVIDDDLTSYSSSVEIFSTGMGSYDRTGQGLKCKLSSHHDSVVLQISDPMDEASVSLGTSDFIVQKNDKANAVFRMSDDDIRVIVYFSIGLYSTGVEYLVDDGHGQDVRYADLFLDHPDDADLLVKVGDGYILTGINGIEDEQLYPSLLNFASDGMRIEISPGTDMYEWRTMALFSLQVGKGSEYKYRDTLHRTIVPDGMDFAFSLQMHADRAFIPHFYLMANISQEYGLMGTYDCWAKGNLEQYGMDSPEYVAALHALQDSGWDIGIHAAEPRSVNRTGVIRAIETISSEFGDVRTWSDHGQRPQDLAYSGMDATSQYYTKDLIQEIGCGWMNDLDTSQSYRNDLNLVGLNYTASGYEGIPTFRVSKQQVYSLFIEPGRQDNMTSWLRALSSNRAVIMNHDYLAYFFCVSMNGSSYSALPAHYGILETPWKELAPKTDFQNCTWYPDSNFIDMLESFRDRSVWFASVRDVYDRSCLVQNVEIEENETHVTIFNKNQQRVTGLTFFTRGAPDYHLTGDVPFTVGMGTGGSWHFIFDLEPGQVIILEKRTIDEGYQAPYQSSEILLSVVQSRIDN